MRQTRDIHILTHKYSIILQYNSNKTISFRLQFKMMSPSNPKVQLNDVKKVPACSLSIERFFLANHFLFKSILLQGTRYFQDISFNLINCHRTFFLVNKCWKDFVTKNRTQKNRLSEQKKIKDDDYSNWEIVKSNTVRRFWS